jgi:predicted permease
MSTLWQDVRYALRMLAKAPTLTAIVILTLALGIGANTAIFGIINGIILRPLPAPSPEQIMVLAAKVEGDTLGIYTVSYPQFQDLRNQADAFSDVFAFSNDLGGLSYSGKANQFFYAYVSSNYFSGLGIQPAAGRLFLSSEGEPGGHSPNAVLGYSYWQKKYGGDLSMIGKQALLDGQQVTIIGVAPKGFQGTQFAIDFDGYVPANMLPADQAAKMFTDRTARSWTVLARLKPGVTVAQAQSSVNVITQRLAAQYSGSDKGVSIRVLPERMSRPQPGAEKMLPVIAGVFLVLAALVLLLACMNVANILLVRATMRQREMAIRAALGASRTRLIRQMLTESVVLAFFGAVGGIVLGMWAIHSVASLLPLTSFPIHLDFSMDWRVFAYALAAALLTGVVVGFWPAWRAGRADVNSALQAGGRSDSAGGERHRVRSVLVVAQVCGSLVLLIVAGLFVRSLMSAQHTYLGFNPDNVLNVNLDPKTAGYDETRTKTFFHELESRSRALPGVQSASLAFSVPMGMNSSGSQIFVEGRTLPPNEQAPVVTFNRVDTQYFDTMRVPLLRGRAFTDADDDKAPHVAIVNQIFADKFWPGEDAIGKRFSISGASGPFLEIVGVAGNGKYIFMGWDHELYFYVPLAQDFMPFQTLQLRTSVPPETLIPQVESVIHSLDPNMPVSDVQSMRQSLAGPNGYFVFRVGAILAAAMGILGLTLAVVGVYGVVSFAASQRTHEIGIRMALGAEKRDILRLVLRQGLVLIVVGVFSGLLLSWALTRTMGAMLMGVSPTDLITYSLATLALAAVGFWACYAPARRAMQLDPMVALRYE